MTISYVYTRSLARIDAVTNYVTQWEFEVTATDSVTSISEVVQFTVHIPEGSRKTFANYTSEEVLILADNAKASGNWETVASARLEYKIDRWTSDLITLPSGFSNVKSLLFDGVNEFVEVGDVAAMQFERTDAFSVSVWFKTDNINTKILFAKREKQSSSPYTYRGYSLTFRSDDVKFDLCSDTDTANAIDVRANGSTAAYADGVWHNVVVTYDGSSTAAGCQIYIDSSARPMSTYKNGLTNTILTTRPFLWGARGGGADNEYLFWNQNLDEGSVWNKELSQSEVTSIYNSGSPVNLMTHTTAANLVGWWRFGDGDTYPTILDNSSNSNHGTMTAMELEDIVADAP